MEQDAQKMPPRLPDAPVVPLTTPLAKGMTWGTREKAAPLALRGVKSRSRDVVASRCSRVHEYGHACNAADECSRRVRVDQANPEQEDALCTKVSRYHLKVSKNARIATRKPYQSCFALTPCLAGTTWSVRMSAFVSPEQ